MAHPKRNSVGLCASAPLHEQPPALPDLRAQRRAVFSRLAGWFLLALLVIGLSLVTPDWLVTSINHEQKLDQLWSQPALVALKTQVVTSGVVEASEKIPMGTGLQQLNVLSVNLANPNVRLGVGSAHNRLLDSGETLSAMAQRGGAVAAINGDFFKINGTRDALGMLEINGQIWQSPASFAVLGVTASGLLTIGHEAFTGSVTAGGVSYPLHAINRQDDIGTANLTLFTPVLGASLPLHGATVAFLQPVAGSNQTFTVVSIQARVARLPVLSTQDALVGSGNAGSWLLTHLASGTTLTLDERTTPDNDLVQAIGGGAILIKDGARYQDQRAPASGKDSARNPLTAIGISKDGTQALLVVCDGNQADVSRSKGLTHAEMTDYLLAHGVYQAMLFDGGGSSEMVARLPGQHQVSVLNSPADGHERLVTNGLFLYSTEAHPGPATSVVVNQGNPLTLFAGATAPISAYALDARENPASGPVQISAAPAHLARISHNTIVANSTAGQGQLLAQAGRVRAAETLQIIDHLAGLQLTPSTPDLANGQRIQFRATGIAPGGAPVLLSPSSIRWSVDPSSLGNINTTGLFAASASALKAGKVVATLGGASASASVAVGQIPQIIAPLTDLSLWSASDRYLNVFPRKVSSPGPHTVSTGSILLNTQIKHVSTDTGSLDLRYHFPQGPQADHLAAYPNNPDTFQIPLRTGKHPPDALGLWVKSDAPRQEKLLLSIGLYTRDNTPIALNLGVIAAGGWTFFKVALPTGPSYPMKLNYIALVSIHPAQNETGNVYFDDLQALYAPR